MKEHDKWRDQHGKLVTEVTQEESIRLCVKEITTKTKDTPISYQQERVVKVCRNDLAPLLDATSQKVLSYSSYFFFIAFTRGWSCS
jgi:hypothetical protein